MSTRNLMVCSFLLGTAIVLTGCKPGENGFNLMKKPDGAAQPATSARMVERDVEAPDVFSVDEDGLWDGRPSLGGVWVAHPSVKDPERVIIRNDANGKFVIGALFRRERENPGPKLQVSSDAAEALGMLAGAPTKLSVVALRREEAPAQDAPLVTDPVVAAPDAVETTALKAEVIETRPVSDVAKTAAGAIAVAQPAPKPQAKPTPPAPAEKPAAPKPAATKGNMFVQIGIFSVEANAKGVADKMSKSGVVTQTIAENWQGKKFWRVVAGPAASSSDRNALLNKIKGLGYTDAYAVSK
ncbi:sporulation domain-containing protein [Thioclava sp. SK-1]|uniref:SPOR domain-containing protein n=1 Tax=Thioclava sp. SK-1 TaxID=1889770 RepID=UPI0008240E69|nr:SPOR domain-containing protein [Thioclava sp. SK-1]OCX61421.1 sporulation domain-containing protein [Thioclava sp. SK-1]